MFTILQSIPIQPGYCIGDDKIYISPSDPIGNTSVTGGVQVYDINTGFLEESFKFLNLDCREKYYLALCGNKLMSYTKTSGLFTFYNLEKGNKIATLPLLKANYTLSHSCASKHNDNLFFVAFNGGNNLNAIYVSNSCAIISNPLKFDTLDRSKELISNICCHPSKPLLFIFPVNGCVQVWNYQVVKKNLVSKLGENLNCVEMCDIEDAEKVSGKFDLVPVSLIAPIENLKMFSVSCYNFSTYGDMISIVWSYDSKNWVSVYDTRFKKSNEQVACKSNDKLFPVGNSQHMSTSITSIAFHSNEPILFINCSTGAESSSLLALCLLDSSLRTIGSQDFDFLFLSCTCAQISGALLITANSTKFGLELCYLAANLECISFSSVINYICIAPEVFIEGDALIFNKGVKVAGNCSSAILPWPSLFVLYSEFEIPTIALNKKPKPLQISYKLYRMRITASSQDKDVAQIVGSIPSICPKGLVNPWFEINSKFGVENEGIFRPQSLLINELWYPTTERNSWEIVIKGFLLSGNENLKLSVRVACFVQFGNDTHVNCFFASLKDVIFYSASSKEGNDVHVLCLHSNSTSLSSMPLKSSQGSIFNGPQLYNYELPCKISSLHSQPIGGPQVVLFVSEPDNNSKQTLYRSQVGKVTFDVMLDCNYSFLCNENVINVIWQSTAFSKDEHSTSKCHGWVNNGCGPYLGVLTTFRVLILSFDLKELNCQWNDGYGNLESVLSTNAVSTSISWIGSSLAFSTNLGYIMYLTAMKLEEKLAVKENSVNGGGAMKYNGHEQIAKTLCTLSVDASISKSVRIVCCLPDRIIYCGLIGSRWYPMLNFFIRPYIPLEPLVLGLLYQTTSFPRLDRFAWDSFNQNLKLLIEILLTNYIPAKSTQGVSTEIGAYPTTQATQYLCTHLSKFGFDDLSLIAAGVVTDFRDSVGSDFPRHRWISPGLKFALSIKAGKFEEACNELLSTRSELQELFLDPDSFGGGALPHRECSFALQFSASAYVLAALGQFDLSRKIADIAGDDSFVVLLLQAESPDRIQQINSLSSSLERKCGILSKMVIFLGGKNHNSTKDAALNVLGSIRVGNVERRSTLMGIHHSLPQCNIKNLQSSLHLQNIDKSQRQLILNRGGGLGPLTRLDVLAMDAVEDWLGTGTPEVLTAESVEKIRAAKGTGRKNAEATETMWKEDVVISAENQKPEYWIDDIGIGRDWDKVVGYYRFSDVLHQEDDDFISTGYPGARMNFVDLSKYATPIEVFADKTSRLFVETSTSAVDPGDGHEKVKILNDIVFASEMSVDLLSPNYGLRLMVRRGSQLDIGMHHQDVNRMKMTVELNIFRSEDAVLSNKTVEKFSLVKRCIGPPTVDTGSFCNILWEIAVSNCGCLMFQFDDPVAVLKTNENEINLGPTESIPVSVWTHIAVVVESSSNHTAQVTLYVNGTQSAKGNLKYSPRNDVDLLQTTIYLGANLAGWRLTEFRLWADSRPAIEIEGQRENYLPLASKKKRMQFRIKGSKKLFGPLIENYTMGEAAKSITTKHASNLIMTGETFSNTLVEDSFGQQYSNKNLGNPPLLEVPNSGSVQALKATKSFVIASPGSVNSVKALTLPLRGNTPSSISSKRNSLSTVDIVPIPFDNKEGCKNYSVQPNESLLTPMEVSGSIGRRRSSMPDMSELKSLELKIELSSKIQNAKLITGMLSDCGLKISDVTKCIRCRLLSHSPIVGVAISNNSYNSVVFIRPPHGNVSASQVYVPLSTIRYNLHAESVVLSPRSDDIVVAYYSNKVVVIKNLTSGEKLNELPMTVPLVYWTFDRIDRLILISNQSLYSWKTDSSASRPSKLFDRIDISDIKRWSERRIIDVKSCLSGWFIITSVCRLKDDGNTPSIADCIKSSVVSVYHSNSRKAFQIRGLNGCFVDSNHTDCEIAILFACDNGSENVYFIRSTQVTLYSAVHEEAASIPILMPNQIPMISIVGLSQGKVPLNAPTVLIQGLYIQSNPRRNLIYVVSINGIFYVVDSQSKCVQASSRKLTEDIIFSSCILQEDDAQILYFLSGSNAAFNRYAIED